MSNDSAPPPATSRVSVKSRLGPRVAVDYSSSDENAPRDAREILLAKKRIQVILGDDEDDDNEEDDVMVEEGEGDEEKPNRDNIPRFVLLSYMPFLNYSLYAVYTRLKLTQT